MDRGSFVIHEGRPAVRFERVYRHPAARVWAAVIDPDQSRQWFPQTLIIEPRVGGTVSFGGDPNIPDGIPDGVVLAFEAMRTLAFTWGDDELRITVAAIDDGTSRFELLNILGAENEASRNAAGWDVCLAELERLLDTGAAAGPHAEAALDWKDLYTRYVESGMPAGAAVPD